MSHGGRGGERELKGQGSLEADRGAILKKFLKGRRVGARGDGEATGTILGVRRNGVRVAW